MAIEGEVLWQHTHRPLTEVLCDKNEKLFIRGEGGGR